MVILPYWDLKEMSEMKLGSMSSWLKRDLINLILYSRGRRYSNTNNGVVGITVGLSYWVSLSVDTQIGLNMEEYADFLGYREVSSFIILVRIDVKSDGTVSVWEGGLLGRSVNIYIAYNYSVSQWG